MKKLFSFLIAAIVGFSFSQMNAQPAHDPGAGGPHFGATFAKLFGDHQTFTADMEFQTTDPSAGNEITMPGKMSFDAGKSRFEMNLTAAKGVNLPPDAAARLKAMGMDQVVNISLPDKKIARLIYPGIQSYVEVPMTRAAANEDDLKIETTELDKETVAGHECIKNKVVITEKDGTKHEATVWNATDLKKFPVRIETNEGGHKSVMSFKNISQKKPESSVFEVPSGYTKYDSMQEMMRTVMMKKMGSHMGAPQGR